MIPVKTHYIGGSQKIRLVGAIESCPESAIEKIEELLKKTKGNGLTS